MPRQHAHAARHEQRCLDRPRTRGPRCTCLHIKHPAAEPRLIHIDMRRPSTLDAKTRHGASDARGSPDEAVPVGAAPSPRACARRRIRRIERARPSRSWRQSRLSGRQLTSAPPSVAAARSPPAQGRVRRPVGLDESIRDATVHGSCSSARRPRYLDVAGVACGDSDMYSHATARAGRRPSRRSGAEHQVATAHRPRRRAIAPSSPEYSNPSADTLSTTGSPFPASKFRVGRRHRGSRRAAPTLARS